MIREMFEDMPIVSSIIAIIILGLLFLLSLMELQVNLNRFMEL